MSTPRNWPAGLPYLTAPQHARDLTAAQTQALRTRRASLPTLAAGDTPAPAPRVRIERLRADGGHPAAGQRGLFAARDLAPGSFVVAYVGAVRGGGGGGGGGEPSDYELWLDRGAGLAVDAARGGNEARFVNDFRGVAPRPNAEFASAWSERWRQVVVGVWVARGRGRGIRRGDEILVSYGKGFWEARRREAAAPPPPP